MLVLWIICGIAIIGITIVALVIVTERKRRKEINAAALALGFSCNSKGETAVFEDLSEFKLFSVGYARKARNVMERESHDIKVSIFDYSYTISSGKNSSTHNQSVVCFRSQMLALPSFHLRPENIFDKLGSLVGIKDIDFSDSPEFSKRYLLKGKDEQAVRDLFHPELRQRIESRTGFTLEGEADKLITYRAAKRIKPADLREQLEAAFEIFNMMKR